MKLRYVVSELDRDGLAERIAQLRSWLEEEVRLLAHDDASDDEVARLEEHAETARQMEALVAGG